MDQVLQRERGGVKVIGAEVVEGSIQSLDKRGDREGTEDEIRGEEDKRRGKGREGVVA